MIQNTSQRRYLINLTVGILQDNFLKVRCPEKKTRRRRGCLQFKHWWVTMCTLPKTLGDNCRNLNKD